MRRSKSSFFVVLVLVLSFFVVPCFAWQNDKLGMPSKDNMEKKFFCKVKTLIAHRDILDLKDAQITQLKELCSATKKELIRNNAEIEILAIDIKSSVFDSDKIDVKAVEKLLDQKYKFKKDKAKVLVKAFAQMQSLLTKEQLEMVKDLKSEAMQKQKMGMKCSQSKSMGMCPKMKAPEAMSK